MDDELIEVCVNTGFGVSIIGAVSLLFGPARHDRFRGTASAILGLGLALIVYGYFFSDPSARREATARVAIAVVGGLIAFLRAMRY